MPPTQEDPATSKVNGPSGPIDQWSSPPTPAPPTPAAAGPYGPDPGGWPPESPGPATGAYGRPHPTPEPAAPGPYGRPDRRWDEAPGRTAVASEPGYPVSTPAVGGPGGADPVGSAGEGPPERRKSVLKLVALGVLVLAVLAYAVPAVILSGEIRPGTSVAGIDIGGMTRADAEAKIRTTLNARIRKAIRAEVGNKKFELIPVDVGLTFDVGAMLEGAETGFPGPVAVFDALTGTRTLPLKVDVEEQALDSAIATVAGAVDQRVREGSVRFKGTVPASVTPRNGRTLDRKASAEAIRAAFLAGKTSVRLPTVTVRPKVSAAEVKRTVGKIAPAAVAGPITLKNGTKSAALQPAVIAANLEFVPDGQGGLRPEFDGKTAVEGIGTKLVDAGKAPKDATFDVVRGKLKFIPGKKGQGVDSDKLSASVEELLAEGGGGRTVDVKLTTVEPKITDEEVKGLGIKEKISEFTSNYPCCAPRVKNIHAIAKILDGYVVRPGETFSLNDIVGERDTARGFVEAPMIERGRLVNSVGGGISQFATTMFNAVFFGGLQSVQHTPHEFYISRYPAGRESTVSFPQPDFRWKNDSKYGVLVKTGVTGTSVTVQFWSTKRYDIESKSSERYNVTTFETIRESADDCIPMPGALGFTIDVWRIFKQNGREIKRQQFHTVYKPEIKLICE
ncbi:VanW family protein [Rhizohabitans arisaemae]|uniref:VanW family protein n=1 Tax=Rhizohabitans arisaemae TaxID=2720610 RepID=UPI0024B1854A|nr:VanW family protein [Rhizohabitans arisaemae]